jgi:hypothetical protein
MKKIRVKRSTLLFVGEGDCEVAFLAHIRNLFCSGGHGLKVTLRNAHGKGPENVVKHALALSRSNGFDKKACLLDTDLPWSIKSVSAAKKGKIHLIGSNPCLEGLLLNILGEEIGVNSTMCKKTLQNITGAKMTSKENYETIFSKAVLKHARLNVKELDVLLCLFEGIEILAL